MIYGRNKTNFPKRDENWQFYFSFGSLKFDCIGCKTAKLQKKKKKCRRSKQTCYERWERDVMNYGPSERDAWRLNWVGHASWLWRGQHDYLLLCCKMHLAQHHLSLWPSFPGTFWYSWKMISAFISKWKICCFLIISICWVEIEVTPVWQHPLPVAPHKWT